jgi:hypothetical protein
MQPVPIPSEMINRVQKHFDALRPCLVSGRWDNATDIVFAALHGWCFYHVWGYWPPGYSGPEYFKAIRSIRTFVRSIFHYDPYDMAHYIRWCFLREKTLKEAGKLTKPQMNEHLMYETNTMIILYRAAQDELFRQRHPAFQIA